MRPSNSHDPRVVSVRRRVLLGLCTVALIAVSCSESEDRDERWTVRADQLLVPAEAVDGRELVRLVPPERLVPSNSFLIGAGAVVVTEVDGAIVGAMTRSVAEIERGWGPIDRTRRHPALGDQPVSYAAPFTLPWGGGAALFSWLENDQVQVGLASRDLTSDELAAVAARTDLDDAGLPAVPGTRVGVIPAPWVSPEPSVEAGYDRGGTVTVHTASPESEAAFLAVAVRDPRKVIDTRTEPSCCDQRIFARQRRVRVAGQEAVLTTLTPDYRVLIVPGDPGAVVLNEGGQGRGELMDDDLLIAIARSLRPIDRDRVNWVDRLTP